MVKWSRWEMQSTGPPAIFLAVINQSNICLGKFLFYHKYGSYIYIGRQKFDLRGPRLLVRGC